MDQIKSQFSQFLTSNGLKGYDGLIKIVILPQFSMSNVHFAQKGYDALTKIVILPQFLASNVHFVRKGCISWRSGGTAPRLTRDRKKNERRYEGVKM